MGLVGGTHSEPDGSPRRNSTPGFCSCQEPCPQSQHPRTGSPQNSISKSQSQRLWPPCPPHSQDRIHRIPLTHQGTSGSPCSFSHWPSSTHCDPSIVPQMLGEGLLAVSPVPPLLPQGVWLGPSPPLHLHEYFVRLSLS